MVHPGTLRADRAERPGGQQRRRTRCSEHQLLHLRRHGSAGHRGGRQCPAELPSDARMILGDIDVGGSHPYPAPVVGQMIGTAMITGRRSVLWTLGAGGQGGTNAAESQDVTFGVTAWQGIGGQAAGTFLALRYLLRQLEQLASNPDYQPVYIQWAATQQSGQYNVSEPRDGWYLIESLEPN